MLRIPIPEKKLCFQIVRHSKYHSQFLLGQCPDVRYKEVLRPVLLDILELEVGELGEPVPGELGGAEPDNLLHLLHGEIPALLLLDLLQPRAHADQHDHDVTRQILEQATINNNKEQLK